MSRWVEVDALIAELQKDEGHFDKEAEDTKDDPSYSDAMWSRANGIRDAIVEVYDAPSLDLVRCAECIHFTKLGDGWGRCNVHSRTAQTIDFCSWGERKESE